MSISYRDSGVDVEKGDALVDWLKASDAESDSVAESSGAPSGNAATKLKKNLISGIGGFAALFRMPSTAEFPQIKKPVLVSSTDGVGTKIKLAADFRSHRSVGQDLVAMCVNDLVCVGAHPLFFLDYYATAKLELQAAREFLTGVRAACAASRCILIGGETAEMPGIYHGSDFDAAGFVVGIVDEDQTLGPDRVKAGMVALGLASSGFHSNGYSLLRKLYEAELTEELAKGKLGPISSGLLEPTRLYVDVVLRMVEEDLVQAAAHITGGGFDNVARVLPNGMALRVADWTWPEAFVDVQRRSGLSREEMLKTLNCGVGMVLILDPRHRARAVQIAEAAGVRVFDVGEVENQDGPGEPTVIYGRS
jgi:phosphoribosylformylglycinamidine cyclo-ligase